MILGVDVYSGYGVIDWNRAFAAGVRFAWIKATEGNEPARNDVKYPLNVHNAKAAGIYVGAYHYAYALNPKEGRPGRSPQEQARRAYAVTDGLGMLPGELPPALDIEWPPHFEKDKDTGQIVDLWAKWEVNAETVARWTLEYLAEATKLWGRKPIVYTYPNFWKDLGAYGKVPAFAEYDLWIAHYNHPKEWLPPDGAKPFVPVPWKDWTVWQFSANGSGIAIPGIPANPVDRNCFKGSLDDLRRLANIDPDRATMPDLVPANEWNNAVAPTVHPTPNTAADFLARDVSDLGLPRIPNSDPPDDDAA